MRIALHQMTSGIDPERNVLAMVNAITRSAEAGAAMYFAPEMSIIIDRDRVRAAGRICCPGGCRRLSERGSE